MDLILSYYRQQIILWGKINRILVEKKYSKEAAARDMFILYNWLLNLDKGKSKADFEKID